jgi:transcriptional regulator with XRE-family HTH domain
VRKWGVSDSKRLRAKLKAVRNDADVTQVQLASRLGCQQDFISKYETGERRLDVIELLWVLRALKVDALEFLREFV